MHPHSSLGIDFGTTHTVAVLSESDGRSEALLFDASPLLPSGVYADSGRLLVGRDAERSARLNPAAYEPNPKRRIDDGTLLLADAQVAVVDVVAAVLTRVAEDTRRTLGGDPRRVVVTHPAGWGQRRRDILADAAARPASATSNLYPSPSPPLNTSPACSAIKCPKVRLWWCTTSAAARSTSAWCAGLLTVAGRSPRPQAWTTSAA
ncbi:hypothetical protein GCM10027610_071500 [Dactylosporangium cerinum]